MPIYEFHCEQCGSTFEIRASVKEKEAGLKVECPTCRGQQVQQIISSGLFMRVSDQNDRSQPCCGPNAKPGCCQ